VSLPLRHAWQQAPLVSAMIGLALGGRSNMGGPEPTIPGPVYTATVPPRPAGLVSDYVRFVGGSPGVYSKHLPAHFFSQWGFPVLMQALKGVPYDLTGVLNAGCYLEQRQPLPQGEPLQLSAQLVAHEIRGKRVYLAVRMTTGTKSAPDALISELRVLAPSGKKVDSDEAGTKRAPPRVPEGAREIGRRKLPANAGLQFALLTGDFNPIHWIRPYARMAGFKSTILHGYGSLAICMETLNQTVFSGDPNRLRTIEVRFTLPVLLPGEIGVFLDGDDVYVGKAPGGPAYLTGAITHD
jgi:acyl dehydratase